jgi:hypothetical protein
MEGDDTEDPTPFVRIAAATANAICFLLRQKKPNEKAQRRPAEERDDKERDSKLPIFRR